MRLSKLAFCIMALIMSISASPWALAGEVLDRIKSRGVIKVATDPAWPPYSWRNEKGEWQGFDAAVAEEISKRMGVKLEFVTPNWDVITSGDWNGEWDLSVGSMSPTEDRAKRLVFPAVYYYAPTVLAVHKDNTSILSPSDATGKRVGTLKGSIFEKYVRHEPMGKPVRKRPKMTKSAMMSPRPMSRQSPISRMPSSASMRMAAPSSGPQIVPMPPTTIIVSRKSSMASENTMGPTTPNCTA
jgi:ABC-type amino acid transport substrate-binding protein